MTKTIFKKLQIFLIFSLLFPWWPGQAVLAAGTVAFSPSEISIGQNESFVMPLQIDNVENLMSVNFTLLYDPTILKYSGVSAGSFLNTNCAAMPIGRETAPGVVPISIGRSRTCGGVTGGGEVARITMTSLAKAGTANLGFATTSLGIYSATGTVYDRTAVWMPGTATVMAPPDTSAPIATITAPTSEVAYSFENVSNILTIAGTAADDRGVAAVAYQADTQTGTANGTADWTFDVVLQEGANTITVTATDAAGNTATDTIVITYVKPVSPPVDEAPAIPAGFKAVPDNGRVILAWTNPTDTDFMEVILYRATKPFSEISTDEAVIVYRGVNHYVVDTGLVNATKYYYHIVAADTAGNQSLPASAGAVPAGDKKTVSAAKNFLRTLTGGTVKSKTAEIRSFSLKAWSEASTLISASTKFVSLTNEEAGKYDQIMAGQTKKMTAKQKYALARFLQAGTASTKGFSLEEKANLIAEFQALYGRAPMYRNDWGDLMKLANGRWPSAKLAAAAKEKLFYQSGNEADILVEYQGKLIRRNQSHEEFAKKLFEAIYEKKPATNTDWNIIRTLAYEGAV